VFALGLALACASDDASGRGDAQAESSDAAATATDGSDGGNTPAWIDAAPGAPDATSPPTGAVVNVDPSYGSGGALDPGEIGSTPLGAEIRMPISYSPTTLASPVVWLFYETFEDWTGPADEDAIILVQTNFTNSATFIERLDETIAILETQYNVDKARYYWAGWSAGGNWVIIVASQNQDLLAGTMVFPGTGGDAARDFMRDWTGHRIRLFYACGTEDPYYAAADVEYEANAWADWYGYQTAFRTAEGASHHISEATYGVRQEAWQWMRAFNRKN
jgi:dienelactone hydrolase